MRKNTNNCIYALRGQVCQLPVASVDDTNNVRIGWRLVCCVGGVNNWHSVYTVCMVYRQANITIASITSQLLS